MRVSEARSVVVPVALVSRVAMAVVNEVDMPFVGHGHVTAAVAVFVWVLLVDLMRGRLALVHVALVHSMDVAVVHIVDVVAVRESDVTAAVAVDVRMVGVGAVLDCRGHVGTPLSG